MAFERLSRPQLRKSLVQFLNEDIGEGDITSNSIIGSKIQAKAFVLCKNNEESIVCGLEEAAEIFGICNCKIKKLVKDGDEVKKGTVVMEVKGNARSILKAERTALNLLMRMSGIASETRKFVKAIDGVNGVKIACTRKTAPGLRYFDKKAVMIGGGDTHRLRLDDMVLIKDNHLSITGSVEGSIARAREKLDKKAGAIKIECEVKNFTELISAIEAGADIVMLDNFTAKSADKSLQRLTKMGLRRNTKIEISGGINLANIKQYAMAGPDIISVGYLTHSLKSVDYSLEIIDKQLRK